MLANLLYIAKTDPWPLAAFVLSLLGVYLSARYGWRQGRKV